VLEVL